MCRPQTPFLLGLNLERGWRSSGVLDGARYGAGAYFHLNGDGGTALGAHGQVDVTASFAVVALRAVVLPALHRRPVFLLVLTTGVRWN